MRILRFLLLQVRNADDPMRDHEVRSFARALGVDIEQIEVFDRLKGTLTANDHIGADMLLLGGSGHYSATDDADWLYRALDSLSLVYDCGKPTFASCWGFQAMARAMGGHVVHDQNRAEVGTHRLFLTDAGREDPVFGSLSNSFDGQMGHEDSVVELPPNASSVRNRMEAYRFDDRDIYCTQFHPELNAADIVQRIHQYPEYIERITGMSLDEFEDTVAETPEAESLLTRFVEMMFPA